VSARSLLALAAVCAVVGLLAYGLLSKGGSQLEVGDRVPDKSLPYLEEGSGSSRMGTIAAHRGEWVLVNLWASWCPPCRHEAPILDSFYRRHRRQGVTVLAINVQDNEDDALAFVKEFHLAYPQLRSVGDERSEAFGTTGLPENFLVNPHGRVAAIWRGAVDEQILDDEALPIIEGKT
jgi:cytochrome c biogenesis protein CcmG/thiol:disulfide interchange protein DsbE